MPASPLQISVIGSTGTVGREIVAQALGQGHTVTAFARTPSKLEIERPNLRIVQGDVLDPEAVTEAVHGQDAVLVTLGGGFSKTLRSEGTQNVVRAMQATGIRRLICQTTLGAGDSWGNLNFWWKRIMFGLLIRGAFDDHNRQEDIVRTSGLDWTLVRPAAFTDGEHTGRYRHGFGPTDRTTTLEISRKDVADFMLRQLASNEYLHEAPGQSY